ncbi:MAG: hypothetical protein IJJ84_12330 [Kiritimatiellae bacterium]|nr:hypothetical protein [Kiritimatiellia bacterium]
MTMSGAKSRRDRMAIAIGVVVLLYAFAAFLWATGRNQAWDAARRNYERELKTLKREKALIADRALWEERAEEARQRMPHVDADERVEKTAARWERVIERLAAERHVNVKDLKALPFEKKSEKEEENPDGVLEMPVEVRYENTSLQRLVEFLYAVNKAEDAMMDVRDIDISVQGNKNTGALKGKIVLTCAYLKGDESEEDDAPKGKTK